jgi:hypothetical protein
MTTIRLLTHALRARAHRDPTHHGPLDPHALNAEARHMHPHLHVIIAALQDLRRQGQTTGSPTPTPTSTHDHETPTRTT